MKKKKKPIRIQPNGGLGNQLFALTLGYLLAETYSANLELDCSWLLPKNVMPRDLARGFTTRTLEFDAFELPNLRSGEPPTIVFDRFRPPVRGEIQLRRYLSQKGLLPFEYWPTPFLIDEKLLRAPISKKLKGNFMNWGYVRLAREKGVQLPDKLRQPSTWYENFSEEIAQTKSICVHVRLDDYVRTQASILQNPDYYLSAIRSLPESFQQSPIWIFSDSPNEVLDFLGPEFRNMPDIRIVYSPVGSPPAESMLLLSQASALVTSASTFSAWASIISCRDQFVIVPKALKTLFGEEEAPSNWNEVASEL